MRASEFVRIVSRDRLGQDYATEFQNLMSLAELQVTRILNYKLERDVRGLEYRLSPQEKAELERVKETDKLQREMGSYRHPVAQLEQLMKYSARILKRYGMKEANDFEGLARELYTNARYFYRNDPKSAYKFDKVLRKSQETIVRWEGMLAKTPQEAQQLYKKEGGNKQLAVAKIVPMIAVLGFFSIFLYSMSPDFTGRAFSFSSFNVLITTIFSFITLVALYLLYKM